MPVQELQVIANELRADVLSLTKGSFAIHLAGPLSSAEIITVLFFGNILRYHPDDPWNEDRDRFVLSCGHYVPILYAVLARAGFFPKEKLLTFGKVDGLPVHPERLSNNTSCPGIEASTGPLGQGMSVAVGMAIALKKRRSHARVYCLASDGELQEGQAWEAIALSVREKLDNMVWIIDNNNVQIEHSVTELAGNSSLMGKFEAFGCHTYQIDGHNTEKIEEVLQSTKNIKGQPVVVLCETVGGRGISFMENMPKWHDGKLTIEQYEQAIKELII